MRFAKYVFAPLFLLAAGFSSPGADAAGLQRVSGGFALACENSATYPLIIGAVSEAGEVVTGFVRLGRHHVHVRLIPMGDGYRYAGANLWFDGKDETAILYFGKSHAVNCVVQPDASGAVILSAKS